MCLFHKALSKSYIALRVLHFISQLVILFICLYFVHSSLFCPLKPLHSFHLLSAVSPARFGFILSAVFKSTGCYYFCEPAAAKSFGVDIVFVKEKTKTSPTPRVCNIGRIRISYLMLPCSHFCLLSQIGSPHIVRKPFRFTPFIAAISHACRGRYNLSFSFFDTQVN